ncbi:MAG: type I-E CRISPR-associated endonuclease Cas1e [Acidobacteriota bacterium]
MLEGRLGLEGARVPQADRHGLLWLGRGQLTVEHGTLRFATAGYEQLDAGDYAVPYQMVSCFLLAPGTSVSHDALRLLARHGCGLVAVGEGGVRFYASMPAGPDASERARKQAWAWADPAARTRIVRRMYAWRLGEVLPATDLDALRGIEGARVKQSYKLVAQQFGVRWRGRRYDRRRPEQVDAPNRAINHASSALQAAAQVAVAVTGALPQLGFIHESSGIAFPPDIADLLREEVLLPIAFGAVQEAQRDARGTVPLERRVRRRAVSVFRREQVIARMIDRIKELLDELPLGPSAGRGEALNASDDAEGNAGSEGDAA